MGLISWFAKNNPIFDCAEYAIGYEGTFLFRAKNEKDCWEMYERFVDTVPESKVVKAYSIGIRPDYPVPVARYFLEVNVDEEDCTPYLSLWTMHKHGRLKKGA